MGTYNWVNKTILIVEDDDFNFIVINEILNFTNVNTIRKVNGKEAVTEFRSNSDIDLILMDIEMPIMNGITATKKIRKFNNVIPIIIVTAYAIRHEKYESIKAGSNCFITKPIEEKEILEIINSYI